MTEVIDTEKKINDLICDPKFQELKSLKGKNNLFQTIAVSHIELWHSAFLKWIIDPKSDLNLQDYPLKRFLYLIINYGEQNNSNEESIMPNIDIASIENWDLTGTKIENEYSYSHLGKKGSIDIHCVHETPENILNIHNAPNIRIIIENKIKSKENDNQTNKYFAYAKSSMANFDHNIFVYLTPDESDIPNNDYFLKIEYQHICDYLLKPISNHPDLSSEHKFLIKQYINNLSKPYKGVKIMALANKEICRKIYETHKEVLDEIYLSVEEYGRIPRTSKGENERQSYNITLTDLYTNNFLNINDILKADYKGQSYEATFEFEKDILRIKYNGQLYEKLNGPTKAVVDSNQNGWTFWKVYNSDGQLKGTLEEIRDKYKINSQ